MTTVEGYDAPVAPSPAADDDQPAVGGVARWEWLTVGAILLVAGAFVWSQIDDYWFRVDDWRYLELDPTSIRDLVSPQDGHLTPIPMLAYHAMYRLVGMDYYPWLQAFRVVGYSLMLLALWRIMRHRGADPVVALVATAYLGVLASTFEYKVISVGMFVAVPALLLGALIVAERPEPRRKDLVIVGALLGAAILSNANGALGVVGLAIVVAFSRTRWRWMPLVGGAVLAFGVWSLVFREQIIDSAERSRGPFEVLADLPIDIFRITANALEQMLVPGTSFGGLLAVVMLGLLGWAVWRGKIGLFEAAAISMVLVYFASLAVSRVHSGAESVDTIRFANTPTLLLVPALIPCVRLPSVVLGRVVVVIVGVLLVAAQANDFADEAQFLQTIGHTSSARITAERSLLLHGEPYIDRPPSPVLGASPRQILDLADARGWGAPARDQGVFARGHLRVTNQGPEQPPTGASSGIVVDGRPLRACRAIAVGQTLELRLARAGVLHLVLRSPDRQAVAARVRTEDRYGRGTYLAQGGEQHLAILSLGAGERVAVIPKAPSVSVCPAGALPQP